MTSCSCKEARGISHSLHAQALNGQGDLLLSAEVCVRKLEGGMVVKYGPDTLVKADEGRAMELARANGVAEAPEVGSVLMHIDYS